MKTPENKNVTTVPFKTEPIPLGDETQSSRGWQVYLNGELVDEPVASIKLVQEHMGINIDYGKGPQGYDQVSFKEPGGGGAVTVPYLVDQDGQIYVGMVNQLRPLSGGTVSNAPRGFLNVGETHVEGAVREVEEETGLREIGSRVMNLANGINPNSAFFDTSNAMPDGTPSGVSTFAIKLRTDELELSHKQDGTPYYRFPEELSEEAKGNKAAEDIIGSEFIPLEEAMQTSDGLTKMAVGDLLTSLILDGEYIVPQKRSSSLDTRKDELV